MTYRELIIELLNHPLNLNDDVKIDNKLGKDYIWFEVNKIELCGTKLILVGE